MRDLIKRILKEEVGVPSGIADSAKRLYLDLITRLKRKTITGNSNFNLLFKNKDGKYSFSDFKNFENIKIEFEFEGYDIAENPSHSGVLIMGMGHQGEAQLNDLFDLVNVTNNTTTLSITLAIPTSIPEITNKDIIKTLMDNQVMIVSSLAHELKHAYDGYKKPTEKLKNRASYSAYSSVRTGIHEVDEFIYFLATAEDTISTYEDGEVLGSIIGKMKSDTFEIIDTQIISNTQKFEGITLYENNDKEIHFLLCEDNDTEILESKIYNK